MNKTLMIASSLALVTSLAACQKKTEALASNSGTMSGNMAKMAMAGAITHGMAAGTVTAIDVAKGTITLDHGAMSGLGWPAMTMDFIVKPELLTNIKVGDKVDFEIDWDGKAGRVTKIVETGS